jgi:hypothetical protein
MNDSGGFKSEFRIFWRIFYLLLLLLFMILPVVFVITKPSGASLPMDILFGALSTFILWLWVKYFKRTYCRWQVINNELHLTYWNSAVVIPLNDIENIDFNTSVKVSLFIYINIGVEGIKITYKGKKYFIGTGDFTNSQHLCRFLEMKVNGKMEIDFQISKPQFDSNEEAVVLNRWGVFSLISMSGYFPLVCLLFLGFFSQQIWRFWPVHIVLVIIGIAISAHYSNYVKYNSEVIQIKNAIFKKFNNYLFSEILTVNIYAQSNSDSEVIELTLKDYSVHRYHINSLSYDESRKLAAVFTNRRIIVKGKFA